MEKFCDFRSTAKILKFNVAQYVELVALGRDIDEEIIVVVVCCIIYVWTTHETLIIISVT